MTSRRDREIRDDETAISPIEPERLPARIEPMMLTHLALTGDTEQYDRWRDKLEAIAQSDAVAAAPDPESRSLLANKEAWRQMRETGRLGSLFGLGIGSLWMTWLIPLYAVGHGFGWLAGLAFLLPIPIAWRAGRFLWEQASLAGMRDMGRRPNFRRRMRSLMRGMLRSFGAGFGFGFTLVFLQALVTWFMTPAHTVIAELLIDAFHGVLAGTITGSMSMMLGPLVSRGAPSEDDMDNLLSPGRSLAPVED